MAKEKTANADKGGQAEEALRNYFRNLGAFVLRGVPIREGRDDITDVDYGCILDQAYMPDTSA